MGVPGPPPVRDTTYAPNTKFGPTPGEQPYFHLTIDWPDQLQVRVLVSSKGRLGRLLRLTYTHTGRCWAPYSRTLHWV